MSILAGAVTAILGAQVCTSAGHSPYITDHVSSTTSHHSAQKQTVAASLTLRQQGSTAPVECSICLRLDADSARRLLHILTKADKADEPNPVATQPSAKPFSP